MLITFQSPAHADVVMRERDANRLLRLMGHAETTPGALDAAAVPDALDRLEAGIAREEAAEREADEAPPEADADAADEEEEEPPVGIRRRAWPLLQMLKAAAAKETHVSWHG